MKQPITKGEFIIQTAWIWLVLIYLAWLINIRSVEIVQLQDQVNKTSIQPTHTGENSR